MDSRARACYTRKVHRIAIIFPPFICLGNSQDDTLNFIANKSIASCDEFGHAVRIVLTRSCAVGTAVTHRKNCFHVTQYHEVGVTVALGRLIEADCPC